MTPQELVSGVVRLVSLPEVCIRVNEMMDDPGVNATEIGKVISQDTSLTARLLKIVNSAFYGFQARIETVSRAVTVIGLRELRGLVLAASAVESFSKLPNDVLNLVNFWRHSVYCGVVSQLLAQKCNVLHSERLFVAGLLHDIGKLVITNKLIDESREVIKRVEKKKKFDFDIEQAVLGFDHAEVGGVLLKEWNMPESLCNSVMYHHRPKAVTELTIEICIVHIANILANRAEHGINTEFKIQEIEPMALEMTG
ncbi:MAG: HDOD domain-containing protein, partial [Gammaproteobacteria bacterium]|nr:HDOD domain-containing protein [Gammaproteobacteria bacterium]